MKKTNLGVALVGLGEYATQQLIPALKETKSCKLTALVSGSDEKKEHWKKECGISERNLYSYENFDQIRNNPEVDIVYIVLPNSMHAEYSIRAAKSGKHVICEKPMAMNVDECHRIIEAVQEAGVKFSMGYRLHFDPYNKEMMRLGQDEIFGQVKKMNLQNSMDIGDQSPWRLDVERSGGGPLMNNGVYCIQAAIYLTGKLPFAVKARFSPKTNLMRFNEVEEGIEWTMFFDGGTTAVCESSYVKEQNLMRVEASEGWFQLDPAYEYKGLKGKTSNGDIQFATVNQQALQMDDFAQCILNGSETRVPADMGLRDMEIISALYESAKTGKKIDLRMGTYAGL